MSDNREYKRPDLKAVTDQLRRDRLRIRLAVSVDSAERAVCDVIAIWQDIQDKKQQVRLLHREQPSDPFWTDEHEWLIRIDTALQISLHSIDQTIQNSRHFAELVSRQNLVFPLKNDIYTTLLTERLREDLTAERLMGSQLWDHFLNASVYCVGQNWSLAGLTVLLSSPQRSIRRAALRGLNDWIHHEGQHLDLLLDALLLQRQVVLQKARFSQGWTERSLQDLVLNNPDARSTWQKLVKLYLVPMTAEIRRLQKKRLNLDVLQDYDLLCLLPDGMPTDRVAVSSQHIVKRYMPVQAYHASDKTTVSDHYFEYLKMIETIHQPSEIGRDDELTRLLTLTRWIVWLVWLTAADDWMTRITQNPEETSEQRKSIWLDIENDYFPDLHHDQMPAFAKGGLAYLTISDWINQGHNLADAFALVSALALWYRHKRQLDRFSQDSLALFDLSAGQPFTDVLKASGLQMPWNETQFKQLMFALASDMDL